MKYSRSAILYSSILLFLTLLILISCSDTSTKYEEFLGDVRIEYSDCSGCLKCIDEFSCPKDAIKTDIRTRTVIIDTEKCINCMQCINFFKCPEEAIVIKKDQIPPAEILDLTAVSDSIGELTLEFTAPGDDNATGRSFRYDFSFKDPEGRVLLPDFNPELPKYGGENEIYHVSGLPEYGMVTVSVQAFDEMDTSSGKIIRTAVVQGTHIDSIPPSDISDLSIGEITSSSIRIRWTAPGNDGNIGTADEYIIKFSSQLISSENWNSAAEYPNALIPSASGTTENFDINGLDPLTNYYFAVKAVDASSNISRISNVASAFTTEIPDTTPPDDITDLVITPAESSVILEWTAPGDDGIYGTASRYVIKISENEINGSNFDSALTVDSIAPPSAPGTAEKFEIPGLTVGTIYYFAIKTVDDAQNSSNISNSVSGSATGDIIPPAAISNLSVNSGYTVSSNSITITWTAPGDNGPDGIADTYEIRFYTYPITDSNWNSATLISNLPLPHTSGTTETFTVRSLTKGRIYYFGIKTKDEAGNISPISNIKSGKIVYSVNSSCNGCGRCVSSCSQNALKMSGGRAVINSQSCNACASCVSRCPYNAIKLYVVAY